jgi:hypothetical protein
MGDGKPDFFLWIFENGLADLKKNGLPDTGFFLENYFRIIVL